MVDTLKGMLKTKGKKKEKIIENYLIVFLVLSSLVLSLGIGLTTVSPKGVPVLMSMFGALGAFVCSASLVILWFWEEVKK